MLSRRGRIFVYVATVIAFVVYLYLFRPMSDEITRLQEHGSRLERENDSLLLEYDRLDSLITSYRNIEDVRFDSIREHYVFKLKYLKDEYDRKAILVGNIGIDDNIRLFTGLISEKDTIPE